MTFREYRYEIGSALKSFALYLLAGIVGFCLACLLN